MARTGIYRTDVEKARRNLLLQGKNPSIDLVRAALGNTGSRTTIHRLLKEIEAEEATPRGTKPAVSDALQALVSRLSEQLHEEANAIVSEHRSESDAKVRAHAEAAHAAEQEAAGLRTSLLRTETSLVSERSAHQETTLLLQTVRIQLAQLEERVVGQDRRIQEQDSHLESLEQKHQHARDALEHFRTQAQEQRSSEQRQHEQALQALQVELRQAAGQVTAKNAELIQLNRDNGRLLEQAKHQQLTTTAIERDLHQARTELESLRPLPAQVQALEARAAAAIATAAELQVQLGTAQTQLWQALQDLRNAELERERAAARLEGMQEALNRRDESKESAEVSAGENHGN